MQPLGGVIPKPRAFTSGARDLAWSFDEVDREIMAREIPHPAEGRWVSG
jgi:hypothetical protein